MIMRHFSQSLNRPLFPSLFPPEQRSPFHGLSTTPSITTGNISIHIASGFDLGFDLAIAIIPGLKPRGYILPSLAGFCSCPEPVNVTLHPISPSPVRSLANTSEQHFRGYKAEHCNQINHLFSLNINLISPIHSFIQLLNYSFTHSPGGCSLKFLRNQFHSLNNPGRDGRM